MLLMKVVTYIVSTVPNYCIFKNAAVLTPKKQQFTGLPLVDNRGYDVVKVWIISGLATRGGSLGNQGAHNWSIIYHLFLDSFLPVYVPIYYGRPIDKWLIDQDPLSYVLVWSNYSRVVVSVNRTSINNEYLFYIRPGTRHLFV